MSKRFLFKETILDKKELEFIKNYILEQEDYVKSLGPDTYEGTSDNSLTGRHRSFNWLTTPIGDILIPKIREVISKLNFCEYPIGVQCWANTFRYNEGINKHNHGEWKFLSGNLFIDGPEDIGTYYFENREWVKYKSIKGEYTLFSSELPHYVPKNKTNDVRISIATDMYPSGDWEAQGAWKEIKENKKRYIILDDE